MDKLNSDSFKFIDFRDFLNRTRSNRGYRVNIFILFLQDFLINLFFFSFLI